VREARLFQSLVTAEYPRPGLLDRVGDGHDLADGEFDVAVQFGAERGSADSGGYGELAAADFLVAHVAA
jgi:hypothetical protein